MRFNIDLREKSPGYKEAFLEMVSELPGKITRCEFGPISYMPLTKEQMRKRIHRVDHTRVCAVYKSHEIIGENLIVTVEPQGPMACALVRLHQTLTSKMTARVTMKGDKINYMAGIDIQPNITYHPKSV